MKKSNKSWTVTGEGVTISDVHYPSGSIIPKGIVPEESLSWLQVEEIDGSSPVVETDLAGEEI